MLTHVELRRARLPLASPFRTSYGVETYRDVLFVRLLGPDTEGWGECVSMSEPLYTEEYVDASHEAMRRHLLPRLSSAIRADDVAGALAPVQGHRMAKAAIEAAVLDAELRSEGRSLASRLGAVRATVVAGVAVGLQPSVARLVEVVSEYVERGYRRVKLKIEPGNDIEAVRAVRERFGDLALQVDANSAYTLADAENLARLDPFGLMLIEQPLAAHDLYGHAELARLVRTPLCLDESVVSVHSAITAIEMSACQVINIKPGRVGGLLEAVRIHDLCVACGVPVWCGGMLETGIGRASNVALAALPGFTLPGDLSASSALLPPGRDRAVRVGARFAPSPNRHRHRRRSDHGCARPLHDQHRNGPAQPFVS